MLNGKSFKEKKCCLRKIIKERIASPDGTKIIKTAIELQKNEKYCQSFLNRIAGYTEAKTVFAYYALEDEFPTFGLLKQIIKDNKILALPVVSGNNLIFKEINTNNGEPASLKKGAYGILEPDSSCRPIFPVISNEKLFPILVITPGRAFSSKGNRLGHGGGYYDRFFRFLFEEAKTYKVFTVGVCFSFQIVDDIPSEEFDIPVQNVFTEIIKN